MPQTESLLATRLALQYVAVFLVVGVHLPFWPVWLEAQGLSGAAIGVVLSVYAWIKLIANPLVTAVADRAGRRRAMAKARVPHPAPASMIAPCEIAAERGAMVDMHCDENDDPNSRMIETLVYETKRLGLQGRVTGSHLTSMHSMDNFYANRLIGMMADAGVHVMANPPANLHLQARFDTYPKRRGLARVPELREAGCTVGFAQDSVLDPWYPLGHGDLLDIAWIAAHACHMTDRAGLRACFDAVTADPAKIMELDGYGLTPGGHADMVILDADDPIEAIRTRATRTHVIRRGKVICETAAPAPRLGLEGRPEAPMRC